MPAVGAVTSAAPLPANCTRAFVFVLSLKTGTPAELQPHPPPDAAVEGSVVHVVFRLNSVALGTNV